MCRRTIDYDLSFRAFPNIGFVPNVGRKTITGSFIGSMKELEEMLEFCRDKKLSSTIETVKMDYINTAFERLEKNDVRYRFVVDVAGSKLEQ